MSWHESWPGGAWAYHPGDLTMGFFCGGKSSTKITGVRTNPPKRFVGWSTKYIYIYHIYIYIIYHIYSQDGPVAVCWSTLFEHPDSLANVFLCVISSKNHRIQPLFSGNWTFHGHQLLQNIDSIHGIIKGLIIKISILPTCSHVLKPYIYIYRLYHVYIMCILLSCVYYVYIMYIAYIYMYSSGFPFVEKTSTTDHRYDVEPRRIKSSGSPPHSPSRDILTQETQGWDDFTKRSGGEISG